MVSKIAYEFSNHVFSAVSICLHNANHGLQLMASHLG